MPLHMLTHTHIHTVNKTLKGKAGKNIHEHTHMHIPYAQTHKIDIVHVQKNKQLIIDGKY